MCQIYRIPHNYDHYLLKMSSARLTSKIKHSSISQDPTEGKKIYSPRRTQCENSTTKSKPDLSQTIVKKPCNSKLVSPRSPTMASDDARLKTAKKPTFSSQLLNETNSLLLSKYSKHKHSDISPDRLHANGPSSMMKSLNQRSTTKRLTQPYSPKPKATTAQEALVNLSVPFAFGKGFSGSSNYQSTAVGSTSKKSESNLCNETRIMPVSDAKRLQQMRVESRVSDFNLGSLDMIEQEMARRKKECAERSDNVQQRVNIVAKIMIKKTHEMFIEEVNIVRASETDNQQQEAALDKSQIVTQSIENQIQRFEDRNRLALFKAYLEANKESEQHQAKGELMVIRDEAKVEEILPQDSKKEQPLYCLSEVSNDKCPSIQILNQRQTESPKRTALRDFDGSLTLKSADNEHHAHNSDSNLLSSYQETISSHKLLNATATNPRHFQSLTQLDAPLSTIGCALSPGDSSPASDQKSVTRKTMQALYQCAHLKMKDYRAVLKEREEPKIIQQKQQSITAKQEPKQQVKKPDLLSKRKAVKQYEPKNKQQNETIRKQPSFVENRGPVEVKDPIYQSMMIQNWQSAKKVIVDLQHKNLSSSVSLDTSQNFQVGDSGYFSVQSKPRNDLAASKEFTQALDLPQPQLDDSPVLIRDRVNDVIFSPSLKLSLAANDGHSEYYRLLKSYQRSICLLSEQTFAKLIEEEQPMKTAFYIGLAITKLYLYIAESEESEISKWEQVMQTLKECGKVYNTMLKTRYMIESGLISEDQINVLTEYLDVCQEHIVNLDVTEPHEAAAFTIYRFLRSAVDLGHFITLLPPTPCQTQENLLKQPRYLHSSNLIEEEEEGLVTYSNENSAQKPRREEYQEQQSSRRSREQRIMEKRSSTGGAKNNGESLSIEVVNGEPMISGMIVFPEGDRDEVSGSAEVAVVEKQIEQKVEEGERTRRLQDKVQERLKSKYATLISPRTVKAKPIEVAQAPVKSYLTTYVNGVKLRHYA
ncbi:hypothetical protein FGO68_gene11055 [Halteria grandinella]|uniref:Uncharacterized protein n=1 Tax=Halteria grandinella TaxID=5974 RepID=A0A8J8T7G5_HALGN|nr:hypothetical protein FGO68_gene11055 [Halteria grandinella]